MNKPEKPQRPLVRIIREGGFFFRFKLCDICGSSMKFKLFRPHPLGCIQPECKNYWKQNV
jgi:hypothetical protein